MDTSAQTLFEAWKIAGFTNGIPGPPATEEELHTVEEAIGTPLPPSLRAVYQSFNGWNTGNLNFFSLISSPYDAHGLIGTNERLLTLGWVIPGEIRLFAGDGCGDHFGIWLPACGNPTFDHPVIEVGGVGECLGIAGTNLLSFLLGWNSFYIASEELDALEEREKKLSEIQKKLNKLQPALSMLQVPQSLRGEHFDDDMTPFKRWADPSLPDPAGDCYSQRYTVADLKQIFDKHV